MEEQNCSKQEELMIKQSTQVYASVAKVIYDQKIIPQKME